MISLCAPTLANADDVRDGQWYLGPLGISEANTMTTGKGVKVAVIDSGVDGSVQDLRGAVVGGKDFSGTGSSNGQTPVGDDSHGTNVASLLAGRGHGNGDGVIGSAPGAQIVSASIDNIAKNNIEQLVGAIRWSADQGVGVINMSIGGGRSDAEMAAYRYAQSKDVVIVAASGNKSEREGNPPCGVAGVVCVGGIDKDLRHDPLANTDPALAVVGPFATAANAQKSSNNRLRLPVVEPASSPTPYSGQIGTSLSAPVVAGVVALIRAKYPQLDAANVVNRLLKTATPAGSGHPNATYGWGIVDADRALTADVPAVAKSPLGSLVAAQTSPSAAASPSRSGDPSTPPRSDGSDEAGGTPTGLVVGVVVIAIVIAGLAVFAFARRRRVVR